MCGSCKLASRTIRLSWFLRLLLGISTCYQYLPSTSERGQESGTCAIARDLLNCCSARTASRVEFCKSWHNGAGVRHAALSYASVSQRGDSSPTASLDRTAHDFHSLLLPTPQRAHTHLQDSGPNSRALGDWVRREGAVRANLPPISRHLRGRSLCSQRGDVGGRDEATLDMADGFERAIVADSPLCTSRLSSSSPPRDRPRASIRAT